MTFKRDKKLDRKKTNKEVLRNRKSTFAGESWLGHTKDCGIIDYELLNGATKEELVKRSGRKLSGVEAHISHLKTEHGLFVSNINGIYKLEFYHNGLNKSISQKELESLMEIDIKYIIPNCIVQLKNSDNLKKWYSIGIDALNKNNEEVISLDINKKFAQNLLGKQIGDYVDFGKGFKVISIKKYLSE